VHNCLHVFRVVGAPFVVVATQVDVEYVTAPLAWQVPVTEPLANIRPSIAEQDAVAVDEIVIH
jgi:hypothetical protein